MATSIRLKRLRIEQLFGSHDVDISFRLDERVTVLHGRNGSGKTVTLKLIAALREGRYDVLKRYPYKELTLEMNDGSRVVIQRAAGLPFQLEVPGVGSLSGNLDERLVPSSRNVTPPFGNDILLGEPDEFRAFRERLPAVKLLLVDRLHVTSSREDVSFVHDDDGVVFSHLSGKLRALVMEADKAYRLISTRLDSTLPRRLFQPPEHLPSAQELIERNQRLRQEEARFRSLGLLRDSPGIVGEATLSNEQRGMFHILLEDLSQKLAPFTELSAKVDRLIKGLSTRLAPKQVRLDIETGYQVMLPTGESLTLERLSSGEQQVVLLHEMLFDVAPGTLILIDEPEISLHVTWQQALLPELMDIAQLDQLDFVVATHSPFIVGDDHADLMVRLGEPQP